MAVIYLKFVNGEPRSHLCRRRNQKPVPVIRGNCTNTRACEAECPKNESISNIARLNREFIKAKLND